MLNDETKRKINSLRDILVGKVPNPASQVEQITNALIYKYMDDMDRQASKLGGKPSFFVGKYEQYSWRKLMDPKLGGQDRMNLYVEALEKMGTNPNLSPIFRDILKGAFLPYRSPETLNLFLHEIDSFEYKHSEELGNAFELLLSIMGSQADAGMFRTPRHIIDFIVAVIAPKKDEKILDPACGTAGFLVSTFNYIRSMHDGLDNKTGKPTTKESRLTNDEIKQMHKNLVGYDISPEMCKLSRVNMFLHSFPDPKIYEYDTLSSDERWDDTFDVIMANPPFMTPKGGIIPHKRFAISANRAEVLFVDYIMEHLKPKGRAGIIVPEGIIFQSATAYKALRKALVEDGLYAVVSLPAGVFNPYAGVKTSILLFNNELAKKTDEIIFVKVEKDGFDLGAQRRESDKNDLPEAMDILYKWNEGEKAESKMVTYVAKSKIAKSGDYNLTGDRYREAIDYSNVKWPMVELGEVCDVSTGNSAPQDKSLFIDGKYPFYRTSDVGAVHYSDNLVKVRDYLNNEGIKKLTLYKKGTILFPKSGASTFLNHRVIMGQDGFVSSHLATIVAKDKKILNIFIYYLLKNVDAKELTSDQAYPSLKASQIKKNKIPLPPLEIQEQIVAELDGYQKVIDGARQVVENWKPTIKIDPEWEKVKLGDVCSFEYGGALPEKNRIAGRNPVVGSNGIVGTHKDFLVEGPAIVVGRKGSAGEVNWIEENCFPIDTTYFVKIKDKINLDLKFLYFVLHDLDLQGLRSGGAVPGLNRNDAYGREIFLPSLANQKQIVEKIEAEQKIVEQNKKLIEIFERIIKEKIDEVWGK